MLVQQKLVLKPINDLLKERFFIPKYQRGYRWDERQVKNLLDDIWEFREKNQNGSTDAFYCLQPVVVSLKENGEWEVIDGQQRLTTIAIILEFLKSVMSLFEKEKYSIRYETRTQSASFLQDIKLDQKTENIDYFHICTAYETIDAWFKEKNGVDKSNFLTTLLNDNNSGKNVKVIWYDVSDENTSEKYAIDIFTRLNIGKIPLTNSELIKALFLQEKNFKSEAYYFKQNQIASEWDEIENQLQNDAFWYFIYNPTNPLKYDTRIEYIFDLMQEKKAKDDIFYTFHHFVNEFSINNKTEESIDIDGMWLKIKQYFQTFQEWYANYEFYHLIGYLIEFGASIQELKKESASQEKNEFKKYLQTLISNQVKGDIRELNYGDYRIKKTLLLFNLETLLQSQNKDTRFPFSKYKTDKWDIEHVRSQTDVNISKSNRNDWLIDVLEYFTGVKGCESAEEIALQKCSVLTLNLEEKKYCDRIIDLLENLNMDDKKFEELENNLRLIYFKETTFESKDSIGNLALLDAKTNRSYKNALFPIKRRTIISNDMNGTFVPICTKNVFLKSYSKKMGEVMLWSQNDAEDYLLAIENTLTKYLHPIEENHA